MPARKDPPAGAAERIYELASLGFKHVGIAAGLEVSPKTFNKWLDDQPDLKEAFDRGRETERQALHNVLYLLATEQKDKIAAMFLLKARHGYREGDQSEQDSGTRITINLPGAMPLDKFVTIENEPNARTERLSDATAHTTRRG